MSGQQECPICFETLEIGTISTIGQKGCDTLNQASSKRNDSLVLVPGTKVHRRCQQQYINKKNIASATQKLFIEGQSAPSLRSKSSFDLKNECLFCGQYLFKRTKKNIDVFPVRTEKQFLLSIKEKCNSRKDQWSQVVLGRLEYCQDLHALEVKYHQQCSVNFRTDKDLPSDFDTQSKHRKSSSRGRPVSAESKEAFEHIISYLEQKEDETITISHLVKEMEEFGSDVYSPSYLKKKLREYYGNVLFFTERDGTSDVITLRENASRILNSFHQTQGSLSEEDEKAKIIATAARLIKADIKSLETNKTHYPSTGTLSSSETNINFLPDSLKLFLKDLLMPLQNKIIESSLGQALMQAVRPKSLLAPLQVGLGIQMHHQTGSRHIVDMLHRLGFCCSYSEVRTFEKSAAMEYGENASLSVENTFVQFVADNVDHNIETIDGLNTFHGMGMITVHTPQSFIIRNIPRRDVSMEEIKKIAKIEMHFSDSKDKPTPLFYGQYLVPDVHNSLSNADMLWRTSWIFRPQRPMWSGFMQVVLDEADHLDKSSIEFLPIIDLKPTDDTCILSTLRFLSAQAKKFKNTPVITFDQPLYWKSKVIVQRNPLDEDLNNIVLRLGGFHTAMSFLGCIGHVMEGSGIENVFKVCYAPNSIPFIMNGKAYSRAVRSHCLLDSALHAILITEILALNVPITSRDPVEDKTDSQSFLDGSQIETDMRHIISDDPFNSDTPGSSKDTGQSKTSHIQSLVDGVMNRSIPACQIENSLHYQEINALLREKRHRCSDQKTANLWFLYLDMVGLLRDFIRAERTGEWILHLSTMSKMLPFFAATGHNLYLKSGHIYLTSMLQLEKKHPEVHQAFLAGRHVVRRSNGSWKGLSTDLTIEQTLMKSVKSTGGLTRGRGMDESQRALWIMAMPACAEMNVALTAFTSHENPTVEEHKDMSPSRRQRDFNDTLKMFQYLFERNPFSGEKELRNISTGQVADASVAPYLAKSVGEAIISSMDGENALTFSFRRKNQIVNMASKTSCQVKEKNIYVDPRLLFQRLTNVAALTTDEKENILEYELCSYPPALFDSSGLPLEARKPALRDALCTFCKGAGETNTLPDGTFAYVLDGGSLLQRIPWTRGSSIAHIITQYCTHVSSKYGCAYVVFDGYSEEMTTKDVTHLRRNGGTGVKINFDLKSVLQTTKELFLVHKFNKQRFISLLGKALEDSGHKIKYARQDADVDIAMTALELSSQQQVVVIGEDTDLLCLLCAHLQDNSKEVYFTSAKQERRVYCIRNMNDALNVNARRLLFAHALLGCDTTSRLFGIGKSVAFKKLQNDAFQAAADVFLDSSSQRDDIVKAGEKALLLVYGLESSSLNIARKRRFKEKVARSAIYVEPQTLPPTTAAAMFHSLRVYFQVQEWIGQSGRQMDPTDWGFYVNNGRLLPIMTDLPPAPDKLLSVITCGCKSGCTSVRCSCRRHGLKCTSACSGCLGQMCSNEGDTQDTSCDDDNECADDYL